VKINPISKFKIHGESMYPTFKPGQEIISFNWAYLGKKPKVGEIIVIKYSGKEIIKRVKKVEGEEVFVEGDNKDESTDSRHFGSVKVENVVGKVIYASETQCHNCCEIMNGIAGRKDAICSNCGFKLTCCGEP
jgi:nickel-type superoxide dismutase maturation protease